MGNPFKMWREKFRKQKAPAVKASVKVVSESASVSISENTTASPPAYSEPPTPSSIPPAKASSLRCESEQVPEQSEPPRPYADTYTLWDAALKQSGLEGRDIFKTTSGSDRKGLAADIQENISNAIGGERLESTTRKVVENSVSILTKFIAVGDVAANLDPVHVGLPWIAVRFVLIFLVGNSELKGQLLAGIAAVAALLVQCDTHQQLYMAPNPTLRPPDFALEKLATSIVQAYADSQRFLIFAAERQQTKNKLNAVFKIDDAREYVNGILASGGRLQRAADDCERYCNLSSRADIRHLVKLAADFPRTIQRQIKSVLDRVDAQERLDILQWISPTPYGKHHNTVKEARTHGTCQWLLEHETFHEWEASNTSAVLWLQGSPGSGKTFLTSSVIDHVKGKLDGSPDQEGFAYFYCNRNEEERRNPLSVLRSYVRQLSTAVASPGYMRTPLRNLCLKLRLEGSSLIRGMCKDQLLESINLYSRTTIVLDALDECDPISRWELIEIIQGLVDNSEQPVKVFISSRPDYDMRKFFSSWPDIEIQAADNQDDIEKFINNQLDKPRGRGPVSLLLRRDIVNTLCRCSQGMFQWAYLQIKQVLELRTEQDIRDRLGRLPSELTDAYDEIYGKISAAEHSKLLVDRACMWVMAAAEPLDSDQLLSAIRVNFDREPIDLTDEITEESLLDLCSHLLVIDSEEQVWRFSHLSVVEYFETNHWQPCQAEAYTSNVCLNLLIDAPCDSEWDGDLKPDGLFGSSHPFQEYLQRHWPNHVSEYDKQVGKDQREADPMLIELLKRFLGSPDESSVQYRTWLKYYSTVSPVQNGYLIFEDELRPEHVSIFTMCRFSFTTLLRDWWNTAEITLSQTNKRGENLLMIAAAGGFKSNCEALLARQMPENLLHDFMANGIAVAADRGHMDIVQLLVENGAEMNVTLSNEYCSALGTAVIRGNADIITLLLQNGADANLVFGDGGFGHALIAASMGERLDIVKLLIENGAETNLLVSGGPYGSALATAAGHGRLETVKLLIENGAETNSLLPTGRFGSALAAAARSGHLEIVKFLIENGAESNLVLPRRTLGSALATAAYWGQLDCVQTLLDAGAEVNLRQETGDYPTALLAALGDVTVEDRARFGPHFDDEQELREKKMKVAELLRGHGATED